MPRLPFPPRSGQVVPKSQIGNMRPLECPAGYRDAKPRTSDDDFELLTAAIAAQARLSQAKLCGTGGKVDTASLDLSKLNGCISKPPASAWVMAQATVQYECRDGKTGTVGERARGGMP